LSHAIRRGFTQCPALRASAAPADFQKLAQKPGLGVGPVTNR
jgi:hypothetical protein